MASTAKLPELQRAELDKSLSFARILSSKLNAGTGTYTVELQVEMAVEVQGNPPHTLYPPLSVLVAIYQTIGDYYPEKEKFA
jgi:hypothetical protein